MPETTEKQKQLVPITAPSSLGSHSLTHAAVTALDGNYFTMPVSPQCNGGAQRCLGITHSTAPSACIHAPLLSHDASAPRDTKLRAEAIT